MGTKFKEINTLSFIGNIGPKTERVWKEVDEEVDIIGCKEKAARPCQLIAPLDLLAKDLPGDAQRIYHRGFGQDEVHFNCLAGVRHLPTRENTCWKTGDFLLIPPGTSHRNIGDMATIRIILYTRNPVRLADEYIERTKRAGQPIS